MLKITTVVMYILYSKWCYGATVKYMEAQYIFKKKTENQHTVYISLKNTHAYQKKKDGVGDKPSECQQQLFLGGGITCDF